MLSPPEVLWAQLAHPIRPTGDGHALTELACCAWRRRSIQTAVASTDVVDDAQVVGSEKVKLFAAVATEEPDVHRVAKASEYAPQTAGVLPAPQNVNGIVHA